MNNFIKDLEFGKIYENKAMKLINYKCFPSKGKCKEYDFYYIKDGKKIYIEVKSDKLACKTGNLCIEYKFKNNPSGISATKSDYWIYFICRHEQEDEIYIIPTNKLKEIIKLDYCRSVSAGDNKMSKCKLVPKILLRDYLIDCDT